MKTLVILFIRIFAAGLTLGDIWADNTLASNLTYYMRSATAQNVNVLSVSRQSLYQPLILPSRIAQSYTSGTSFSGKVERYLLNPEGLVDGLMLDKNLQVTFPPHLANSLVTAVKPGDSVTVVGKPGISSDFGQEIRAASITNVTTQHTVVNQPPSYPLPSPRSIYNNLSVEGTAQYWLVGRRGEIKGIILSSGDQVRFPPHINDQLPHITQGGAKIQAQGFGSSTRYGQVLEATSLKVNGQPVNFYPKGIWPGNRHKKRF